MPTPYPELPEPLFDLPEDAELQRLRKHWDASDGADLRHQRERGWGDCSVCLGPDGPTDLPDWGLAIRPRG